MTEQSKALLSRLFPDEGAYCNLLALLLSSESSVARDFRQEFEALLRSKGLPVRLDQLTVLTEKRVLLPDDSSQTIDLVLETPEDVIGVEVKVFRGSARAGQVGLQYEGLRRETSDRRVHSLFLSPMQNCSHHKEAVLRPGDAAASISWEEVFHCFSPEAPDVDIDALLVALMYQARCSFPVEKNERKTEESSEREVIARTFEIVKNAVMDRLGSTIPELLGCTWAAKSHTYPKWQIVEGPVRGPDGSSKRGQYLQLLAVFDKASAVRRDDAKVCIPVAVKFVLSPSREGVRRYGSALRTHADSFIAALPGTFGGASLDRNGRAILHRRLAEIHGDEITIDGEPAEQVLAGLVTEYARVFANYLLGHAESVGMRQTEVQNNQTLGCDT